MLQAHVLTVAKSAGRLLLFFPRPRSSLERFWSSTGGSMSNITPKVHADMLKEQGQLVKLEAELMKMLTSVNQNLNALKVEELHLKSNTIQEDLKTKQGKSTEADLPAKFDDNPSEVNTQEIDLDLLIKKFEEEDDSD